MLNAENGLSRVFQSMPHLQPETFVPLLVLKGVSLNYSLGPSQLWTFPSFSSSTKCTSTPSGKKLHWCLNWFSLLQFIISSTLDMGIPFYLSFSLFLYLKVAMKCFLLCFSSHPLYVNLSRCFFSFSPLAFLSIFSSWSTPMYTAWPTKS